MDGIGCARQLTQNAQRPPRVLMVTAFGRDEAMQCLKDREVAVAAVLTKPVTPSRLLDTCSATLGRPLRSLAHSSSGNGLHAETAAGLQWQASAAGRGQPRQRTVRTRVAEPRVRHGHRCRRWAAGARLACDASGRCGADGLPDAGDGWLCRAARCGSTRSSEISR